MQEDEGLEETAQVLPLLLLLTLPIVLLLILLLILVLLLLLLLLLLSLLLPLLLLLRKAVVDHVSDSFLESGVPLTILVEAARCYSYSYFFSCYSYYLYSYSSYFSYSPRAGKEREVEEYSVVFTEHSNKLVEVRVSSYSCLYTSTAASASSTTTSTSTLPPTPGGQPGLLDVS